MKKSKRFFVFIILGVFFIHFFFYLLDFGEGNDSHYSFPIPGESNSNSEKFEKKFLQQLLLPEEKLKTDLSSENNLFTFYESTTFSTFINNISFNSKFWWISSRIQSHWPIFSREGMALVGDCNNNNNNNNKKKIILIPGVLTMTNFATIKSSSSGGPLGELIQWSDLIAGLLALCYKIIIKTDIKQVIKILVLISENNPNKDCSGSKYFDLIFLDSLAFVSIPETIRKKFKNKFRILDIFGTEAEYNDKKYMKKIKKKISKWEGFDLHLKQYYTFFPHTPDNSHLGFVIIPWKPKILKKYNTSLILIKQSKYLNNKFDLLENISQYFSILTTLKKSHKFLFPKNSYFLGNLNPEEYKQILVESKICVGVGDPIESPSPLVSLASGCVFLNPISNYHFKNKPTNRKITSQHVYIERYFKPPFSYLYYTENFTLLSEILSNISTSEQTQQIIPYIFTVKGFLENLDKNIKIQDFCNPSHQNPDPHPFLPPLSFSAPKKFSFPQIYSNLTSKVLKSFSNIKLSDIFFLSKIKMSCTDFCFEKGLICNPDYFYSLNDIKTFRSLKLTCKKTKIIRDLISPAFNPSTKTCFFQPIKNPLFSCSSNFNSNILINYFNYSFSSLPLRVCPCVTDFYGVYLIV